MKTLWKASAEWNFLSSALRARGLQVALFSFGFIYLFCSFFEIPLWRCTWKALTGWRCPGCGLTEGCKAFLRGDFSGGLSANWLTPLVLLGFLVLPVLFAIPARYRVGLLERFEVFERRSRLSILFLVFLIVHIGARLVGWA